MTEQGDPTDDDQADATKREGPNKRAQVPDSRLERGTLVGRYVVLDVLGQGGMGIVYAAWDPELDRKVAIKLLQAKPAGGSSGGDQAWLLREAQALARLSHPNVVSVHDVGLLPGDRVFVAMELVEGSTMRAWLKAQTRPWREAQQIMLGAGAGLAAAHAAALVHRDFKPENVLIGSDGRVRVMDFGLARLDSDEPTMGSGSSIESRSPLAVNLTAAGSVVGTPGYMAPEIRDGQVADARSDQFSFGVALYEALYRARPYDRKPTLETPTKAKPPTDGSVPASIERVVMRAISINPDERFKSMDELLANLAVDPVAKRQRVLLGAGLAAAFGVVIVGAAMLGSHDQPCKGAETRLAGVWDAATKTAIRTAFIATKRSFAARAFDGVDRVLDGYSTEWTSAVVESCRATRVRGEQTEAVLTLRQDCLDQRLEELHAFTQLLATADEAIVDKAGTAALGLEPVKKCANVAALREPNQAPPEARAKVLAILARLADAKAGLITGKLGKAINGATAAVEGAKQIPLESVESEGHLVLGMALLYIGNPADAEPELARSIWTGLRSKRDDVVAVAAFNAAMLASQATKNDQARTWLALGAAIATRIGMDRPLELRRLEIEGIVEGAAGNMPAAVAAHEKALATAIQVFGRDNTFAANDEQLYAATLLKSGEFAKALPHYERARILSEAYMGPEHPDVAVILTGMASCYALTGERDKAHAMFERALAIQERIFGADSPNLIPNLNNTAEALRDEGDTALAIPMIERAKTITEKTLGRAHPYYHNVATTYGELLLLAGRVDEARAMLDDVLVIENKTQSSYLAYTLMARARLALAENMWDDAASFDERSIASYEAADKDSPDLWRPLTGLAQAKIGLGKPAEARPLLERAIAIAEKAQVRAKDLAPARAGLASLTGSL